MDFVVKLLESSNFDAVITIVDSVSKRVHIISTYTTVTIERIVRLFLYHTWKLYSLFSHYLKLKHVICYVFCQEALPHAQSQDHIIYHLYPQSDRQTERVNQELDQYLQTFVNKWQSDWYNLLLIAEFQHNNHMYSSTQQSYFLLNIGYLQQMGFKLYQQKSKLENVSKFAEQMKSALEEAKSTIQKSHNKMTCFYSQ